METATNPQTGETIAYVNGQWVPIPTGGLSFDRLRDTPRPVTPLDGAAYAAPTEDVGLGGQFMRSAVNAAGADTVAGIGGALQSLGFEETGQGLRDWGERNALPPAGVRSIGEIDSWGDIPSYVANMGGMAVGSTLPVVGTAAVGALAGSAVPVVGTVAGGLTGAALGSYGINEGQTYIQIRQALEDAGASKEDAHTTAAEIAIPLGVPIAALDVFSLSRALPFLKGSVRDAAQSVVEEAAKRGLLGTAARETLAVGTREGVTETAQTGLQELGQASVDPNYDWSQIGTKMVDSAVAGALGGGMFGAFGAPSARANARAEVARRADVTEQDAARAAAIETRDTQNRVIDQIAGQQLLLPPPSAETRRTPYRAAAMADLTAAQDAVTRVEGTLAAYPTPANQKRLEIVTRARDSALARLESIDQTDVFASQQEAPQVSATTRSAIEDQETERRRKAAVDAEAAARGVAPAAVTREQTAAEALRLKLESIDRAIRSVKADLKQRPGFAPSVAKLNFYDQQRAAAVAALGPKPADQLSGATRTIRAPSPDTDIQAFARETARKIVGDPNFWVPIKESDKAPVTGYVNYQTGEIRTPEQHAAPIETPLSGRDPTIPSPETMAQRAKVEKAVATGATAAQDAAAADQAVVERQRQDAVTAAQNAQREAIAEQEKADAATATAAPEPVGETPNSEQVGDAPQGLPSARPVAPGTTILPGQKDVPVDYAVVEADEVIASQDEDGRPNQFYPPALQPRDRTRASSEQQITELANRLDPRLLDQSPRWNDGAPIVGADGFVDSGNGRTLAIKRAYERGLPTAENYKRHLAEQGYPVEGMQKPMLVRIDRSGADLQTRATRNDVGNKPAGLGLSPTEQAASDARLMGDAILDSYRGGALTDAANRPLIRQFMERAMTTEERGRALTSDGEINQDAVRRVQNALLARAYGDPSLIEKLVEDQDNNVRAIGGAMLDASPTWGKMRAAVGEGRLDPKMDPTAPLIEAMRLVSRARSEGILLGDLVAQQDAFSGRTISPNAEFMLRMMFRDAGLRLPVGREKLADRLRQIASKVSRTAESDDIFGAAPDLGGILQEATEGANREDTADSNQGDLLARKPGPVGAPGGVRGGASAGSVAPGKAVPQVARAKNAGSGSKVGTTESVVSAKGPKAAAEARAAAKAAATDTPSKPKKGDLVAVEKTSSASYTGGRASDTSSRWVFARITKMKADGTIASVTTQVGGDFGTIFAPGTRNSQTWSRIATIDRGSMPDGKTADDIIAATEAENFRSPEELRDAFIAMGAKTTKAPGGPAIASESEAPAKKPAAKPKPDKAMRPDEPGAEPAPQSHESRIAKAETDIRAMLKRMTGKDIDFSILGEPMMIDGQAAAGGYNTQTGALVVSAFDDSGHAYSPDQLLGIARHEAIHWMKDNGLFPEGSWSALEKATPAWMTRFKIKERYGNLTAEQQREEAIAEAYRAWGAGRLKLRGGPIQTAFEFIKRTLASIRGLFQQNGFQSVEDIFRGIDTGAFAKADEETGPSNIGRDSEWTMLAIGGAPGAPATMSIEDQMRASTARVWGVDRLFGDTKTARSVGSFIDRTRGSLQYYMLPWQRAEEAIERITGQPLPEGVRATTAELYVTGKLGHARLEKDRLYYQPVMDLIKKHNIPLADVGNYLLAMHAPERNAQIAKINPKKSGNPLPDGTPTTRDGSGITDAEAAKRLKDLNAKPYAPQLAEIQKLVVEMNNAGLDILVQGGRMSTAQAERLKTMYQNYVNLSGIEDPDAEFDEAGSGTGRGFMGTRGPAVKRATGRFSEPTDILANSLAEFDARVARAEKNLVAQAAFNLAAAHPDPNVWTVDPVERKARINPKTGNVSYTIQQDRGADVMLAYVDGDPFAVRFNTQRQQGRDLYESLAKLNGVEVNRVFALMMRANQLLSRLNTTLNPEFMLSAPIKDWQEAGINLQQYGVKRVAQKTAGHLPGAMKAAYRYMGGKEPGGEWDKWAHDFAAGGGITYFADQTSSESYVKQINRDIKKRSGPVGLTMGGVRALWHAIERTNNAADMGTRLAAYRTLVEAGMSKGKAVAAAKNLTVNFNRKGSQGPAMNALFMFFNASVQGTATMATAIKNSNVVKGLVLGVVATGIAQELALSLLSPPDPDDPSRTVYDAIPEYVKQRNLILWVDEDGSYGMFPKPWGYGFFHDVGRVMTRYLRGAPMGVGRSASVLDTIRDTATSFANAFVPPGFDSALPVPTIFNPLVEVATNKDYTGKPIMPARMPGDRRPNSQMFYPGESPITVGVADALNSLTGGDQFRPGLVDISPEALSHVFSSYAGAAGSFYTRAANTIWGAGAEALGFNREDPDLDWNDVPFGRKIVGQTGSWQVQDLTYQRIADVELLEDEIAGYQEQGDRERARELRAQNGPLVALAKEGRRVRRELSEMRRDRQALLDGPLPTDQARARIDALEARQDRVMAAWNARYVRALARVQARTP